MKRILAIGIILLFIGMSISSSTGFNVDKQSIKTLNGKTLYVGGSGPGNYTKIQDAIDDASDGDTVFVYNGTYVENLIVDKSINLKGESRTSTVIDGQHKGKSIIEIGTELVSIHGFTITNSSESWWGIMVRRKCDELSITENIITKNNAGISIFSSNNNNISYNLFLYNDRHPLVLSNSSYNSIRKNGFKGRYSTSFPYSIEVYSNSIQNKVVGNIIDGGTSGIDICSDSNIIYKNIVRNCDRYGIKLYDTTGNNVSSNIVENIGSNGIYIFLYSNHNIISQNKICNSTNGIYILQCSHNIFINNSINNNMKGIYLYSSSNNNIFIGNNFILNNEYGMYIFGTNTYDNIIYHNNFINIFNNARDLEKNFWDNGFPSGGNYWSDYTGNDSDGDGIGDTPYPIPGGDNEDKYPLMEPWGGINRPYGPSKGLPGKNYTFYIDLPDDLECEPYYIYWDWGDGHYSGWMGPYEAGESACATHSWDKRGEYDIRVKIRDGCGNEYWSLPFTITIVTSILEIGNITGGLFKIKATIKNIEGINATNVHWRITLEDGIILIGRNSSGLIPFIPAGMEEIISSTLIIGLGPVKILFEVWIPGSLYAGHEQLGFVFLFFVKLHTFG